MIKLALFYIILLSQICFGQKKDEIYVYFDNGKGQERFFQSTKDGLDREKPSYYIFYDSQNVYLMFGFTKIDNPEVRIEKKSFLKNKNIVKANKLLNMDLLAAGELFTGKKVFIIDTEEFNENKIVLREVRVGSSLPSEM